MTKASDVNKILEQRCKQHQLGLIKHEQIVAKYHTNGSNLHLNRAGDSILAKSLLREMRMTIWICNSSCLGGGGIVWQKLCNGCNRHWK